MHHTHAKCYACSHTYARPHMHRYTSCTQADTHANRQEHTHAPPCTHTRMPIVSLLSCICQLHIHLYCENLFIDDTLSRNIRITLELSICDGVYAFMIKHTWKPHRCSPWASCTNVITRIWRGYTMYIKLPCMKYTAGNGLVVENKARITKAVPGQ